MKKSQKIIIDEFLRKLKEGKFLGAEEEYYVLKIVLSRTGIKIVFELHQKLAELLQRQFDLTKPDNCKLYFNEAGQMIVEANGFESHLLAGLLEMGYERLSKERKTQTAFDKKSIEEELGKIMSEFDPNQEYTTLVRIKNGKYRVNVQRTATISVRFVLESESPEILKHDLSSTLPKLIQAV